MRYSVLRRDPGRMPHSRLGCRLEAYLPSHGEDWFFRLLHGEARILSTVGLCPNRTTYLEKPFANGDHAVLFRIALSLCRFNEMPREQTALAVLLDGVLANR